MDSNEPKVKLLNAKNKLRVESIPLKIGAQKTSYTFRMKFDMPQPKRVSDESIDLPIGEEAPQNTIIAPEELHTITTDATKSDRVVTKSMQKYAPLTPEKAAENQGVIELLDEEGVNVASQSEDVQVTRKRKGVYHVHSLKIIPKCEHKTPQKADDERKNEDEKKATTKPAYVKYNQTLAKIKAAKYTKNRPRYLEQLPPKINSVRLERSRRTYEKKAKKTDKNEVMIECVVEDLVKTEEVDGECDAGSNAAFINEDDQEMFVKTEYSISNLDND